MYIPEIGDELRLDADWCFDLFDEYRNESLLLHFGYSMRKWADKVKSVGRVTIPKGEVLKVDRIYIRKNASEFSSVSFYWGKKRFWVKLIDVNSMEFVLINNMPKIKIGIHYPPEKSIFEYNLNPDLTGGRVDYNDLRYNIDGVDFVEKDLFGKNAIEHVTSLKNFFGFPQKNIWEEIYYTWKGTTTKVSKESIKTYICKKHSLNRKDCTIKTLY